MRRFLATALVAFLIFSVLAGFLSQNVSGSTGNIIYVNANGTANYTTIQAAVNAANPGDEIFVYAGEYHENVIINKNLVLIGQNKDDTIIDGGGNSNVMHAYGSDGNEIEIQISGFTIRNAGGTGNDCISLNYVDSGTINDNIIMNSAESDGIQLAHSSGITISENTITGNANGCGIDIVVSVNNIICSDNQIQSNQKGIYLSSTTDDNIIIHDNTISGNTLYGVHIFQSLNNILYLNDFSNNGQNALDQSTNSWSYNGQGNYWNDWKDNSGYPNTYNIPGGNNQDLYPSGPLENQKPVAYIDSPADQSIATYGHSLSFSGHGSDSDGTVVGYNWRSNVDGQLSTSSSFSTAQLSLGPHTIHFKVLDNSGDWSDEQSISITIVRNQEPTAQILSPAGTYTYKTPVQFSGSGTDPDGTIVTYSWRSIPSGIISSQASFTLSNLPVAEYTIYLKVKDDFGDWSPEVSTDLVIVPDTSNPDEPPVANASGPYFGYINNEITFNGGSSYDPDSGDTITYQWNFGDNTTGEGPTPTHTYSTDGNYTVELTVVDSHGEQSRISTYAYISTQSSGNQNNNGNGNKTPGFEIILFLISVILVMNLIKNKKKFN